MNDRAGVRTAGEGKTEERVRYAIEGRGWVWRNGEG